MPFPFDVFAERDFPGEIGDLVRRVEPISYFPPYPWGQWLFARVFQERCASLEADLVEAGVARGGLSVFMALLTKHLALERTVYSVDSFGGLPTPEPGRDNPYFFPGEYTPESGASVAHFVATTFAYGVQDTIDPVAGFFEDVLPELAPGRRFAFVHVDADLHGSVACALECLYDRLVDGGVVAIDDFFHPAQGPLRAAAEFFNSRGLLPVYHVVFPYGVFVIKGEEAPTRPSRSVDGNAYSLEWLRNDEFLLQSLERSLDRAEGKPRARTGCRLLLDVLRAPHASPADIYDYWRALEEFWEWIDVLPGERKPHLL